MTFEQLTNMTGDLRPNTLVTAYSADKLLYCNMPVKHVLCSVHKNDIIKRFGIVRAFVNHGIVFYATAVTICVEEQQ